jgi:hypothetical protein
VKPGRLASILFAVSAPVLVREGRRQRDPRLAALLLAGLGVKLAAAFAANRLIEYRSPEGTDPDDYHAAGAIIAPRLRAGRPRGTLDLARTVPFDTRTPPVGTNAVRFMTGAVYAVVGPSKQNGFVVFSWLGFWGQFLFHRAFAVGVPDADARPYASQVLFLPSVVFWGSSLGKEPLMLLGLGSAALGSAHALDGEIARGAALVGAGGALAILVRPYVLRWFGPGLRAELEDWADLTEQGNAAFRPPPPGGGPGSVARTAASVLFRPFPHEARVPEARAAAAEGAFLMGMTVLRAPQLAAAARRAGRRPYIGVAAAVVGGLIAALAGVANFGVLNRQRVPLLPFYLVLLNAGRVRRRASA